MEPKRGRWTQQMGDGMPCSATSSLRRCSGMDSYLLLKRETASAKGRVSTPTTYRIGNRAGFTLNHKHVKELPTCALRRGCRRRVPTSCPRHDSGLRASRHPHPGQEANVTRVQESQLEQVERLWLLGGERSLCLARRTCSLMRMSSTRSLGMSLPVLLDVIRSCTCHHRSQKRSTSLPGSAAAEREVCVLSRR